MRLATRSTGWSRRRGKRFCGGMGEWCVGTAKDPRGPFFQNHLVADLGDGLIYREAFTLSAAQAIRDHFVNDCGLDRGH